jgi:hypothetical protein
MPGTCTSLFTVHSVDPEVAAVLLTILVAGLLAVPALVAGAGRRREVRRVCALCGRILVLGERTCDCDL